MKAGEFAEGSCVLRAKIDMAAPIIAVSADLDEDDVLPLFSPIRECFRNNFRSLAFSR